MFHISGNVVPYSTLFNLKYNSHFNSNCNNHESVNSVHYNKFTIFSSCIQTEMMTLRNNIRLDYNEIRVQNHNLRDLLLQFFMCQRQLYFPFNTTLALIISNRR